MTTPPPDRAALIEVMARGICRGRAAPACDYREKGLPCQAPAASMTHSPYPRQAAEALTALEAAGGRVVPAEPTPEMISAAEEMHMPMGEMIAAWDGFMSASPYREP